MEEIKEMKSQFSKLTGSLAISERGKLPSQPQFNTQGQHMAQTSNSNYQNVKEANAITTRSGKALEDPPIPNTTLKSPNVVSEMPSYAKIMKDLCTVKRKHHVKKTAFLTEQVSAPASVVLQLADRSIKKPQGIVEDVLVQVDKFYYPVDFLILDTQYVVNMESKIPIILGRPFLAIVNALINCRNGLMKISFGNMTLEVNIFHVAKQPHDDDECYQTFLINTLIPEEIQLQSNSNDLDELLSVSESSGFDESINEISCYKDSQNERTKFWQPHFEELPSEREKPKPSAEEVPLVMLAQLPEGSKHVFLGDGDTYHVIISSKLDPSQEIKLIKLLQKLKSALGWTITDIKDADIIYPVADSKWVSPTQVVPKKSGVTVVENEKRALVPTRIVTSWQMCIDYRKLNSATRKDHFPLPFID
ncbi:uncharacterized protein LOC133815443 [Humulus lupulus]|uniref:uncharacterized protein LOC133815443 n=1 Tax=Humulus lupulus TaxID=3486 RepID=UPI002B4184F1|nr:uncharacterized protein LOC133815443 [Humulus lupulus]